MVDVRGAVGQVQTALAGLADPGRAEAMGRYMKTEMPFYGVQSPDLRVVLGQLKKEHRPGTHEEYLTLVTALWELPHREEKYLAQRLAAAFPEFITPASLDLCRRFISEGAWWDFVDETATHMIRHLVINYPGETWPAVEQWVEHEDMWFRRAAIICQVGAREKTDADRLFRFCAARMHETEFFIRKAIGWALRDYARTDPGAVARFVTENRDRLSGLSYREATKHIGDLVD